MASCFLSWLAILDAVSLFSLMPSRPGRDVPPCWGRSTDITALLRTPPTPLSDVSTLPRRRSIELSAVTYPLAPDSPVILDRLGISLFDGEMWALLLSGVLAAIDSLAANSLHQTGRQILQCCWFTPVTTVLCQMFFTHEC